MLTPASNNLVGLRDAINNLGVGVSASILTTGSGNYLSVSANNTGLTTLQLIDDPAPGANINLLTSANQGKSAVFNLNSVPVTKASNTVNDLVSGATFTILNTTAEPVTLSLATDRSQLQSAIQDLTTKYNSMVDQVDGQIGPSAGLLTGDSTLRDIQSTMRKLTSFQGSGSIRSLTDLGIQLGSDGKMTFDTKVFTALSDTQISSAFDFFGSPTTGFGGVSQDFTQITDPINGLIKLQQDGYDAADKRLQGSISDLNDRITQLQTRVSVQLQAADALQAQLTAQQQLLTASLAALTFTSYGKPVGS